jgi:hypothetical protein
MIRTSSLLERLVDFFSELSGNFPPRGRKFPDTSLRALLATSASPRSRRVLPAVALLAAGVVALPARAQAQLPLKSYGQELVDQVVARNPGLLVIVMHVSPPDVTNYPIIASNIGRIGKVADEDDMRVITTEKTNLEVAHSGTRFEVELVMRDVAGNNIGALGLVFPYKQGDNKAALEKKAIAIRDGLAKRILEARRLVETHPFAPLATTKTHAQKLIDETMAKHPELNVLAMHVTPPKATDNIILASSFGSIGKKSDDDDAKVIATGQARAGAYSNGKRYGVELPLLDKAGKTVGALSVGWPYHQGDDEKPFMAKAAKVRDELRQRIPSIETLVELDP